MKAAVFRGRRRFEIQEVPSPSPGAGEVLVRVGAVGVCGSDLHGFEGRSGKRRQPGLIMGHEAAGEVAELGTGVRGWKAGDRVVIDPQIACGECLSCRSGWPHLCEHKKIIGSSMLEFRHGALAEYIAVPERQLHRLPDSVTFEEACLVEPAGCSLHVYNRSGIEVGSCIAVIGAGTIGLVALQVARMIGAGKVMVVDLAPNRLELARRLGADVTIQSDREDPVERLREETAGRGVDYVVEAVGLSLTYGYATRALRRRGKILALGFMEDSVCFPIQPILFQELSVIGSTGFALTEADTVIELIEKGRITVKPLVTHTFTLEDTQRAFETFADPAAKAIKVVVNP